MDGSIDFLYVLKKNSTVKEKLDENQINKSKEIRTLVSNEFEKKINHRRQY